MSRNEHGHGDMAKQMHTTLELKPKQREHYQFREGLRAERDSQPRAFQQSTAQRAKREQREQHKHKAGTDSAQEDRGLCYTWLGFSCVLYKLLETNRYRSPQIYQTRRLPRLFRITVVAFFVCFSSASAGGAFIIIIIIAPPLRWLEVL